MSAFFVNEAVIDDTVTVAIAHAAHWDPVLELDPANLATDLGRKLYAMNAEAICQCYTQVPGTDEHRQMDDAAETYEWRMPGDNVTVAQMITSARCLRYQCSEGNIDTTPLYQWLDRLIEVARETAAEGRRVRVYGELDWDVPGEDAAKWDRAREDAA